MLDRAKVTTGIVCCKEESGSICSACPYAWADMGDMECIAELSKDVLELLTEQEEQIKTMAEEIEALSKQKEALIKVPRRPVEASSEDCPWLICYVCPDCRTMIDKYDKFCKHCGRELEWREKEKTGKAD